LATSCSTSTASPGAGVVRHLVLPDGIAGTDRVLSFLAEQISRDTNVNLMHQYRPCCRADEYPGIDRPLARREYADALAAAQRLGLRRLDARAAR
jgi:putative pyruvate formate lyase activating enzyme